MNFFWLFWLAAFLLAVLVFDITWWQALIVILLSNFELTFSKN